MNRHTLILAALLVIPACEPDTGDYTGFGDSDTGAEFRNQTPTICRKTSEPSCRIDFNGLPCASGEIDPCIMIMESPLPVACTEPLGQCYVPEPGDPCPQGWHDACTYFL